MIMEKNFIKECHLGHYNSLYYGNIQAIPIIGNVVIPANHIIIHHMNTLYSMNLLYPKHDI